MACPYVIHLPCVAPDTQIEPCTDTTKGGLKPCSICVLILLQSLLLSTAKALRVGDVSDSQDFERHIGTY